MVEAVHGMLKQKYRLLDHKIDNKLVPNIGIYYRMALFLNNAYDQRLQSDKELSYEILPNMHAQEDVDNTVATEAEEKGCILRKTPFKTVTADEILNFPEMSKRHLIIFSTGSYQLSQGLSYLVEKLDKDGKLTLKDVKEESNVLKFKVQFRQISRAS